MRYGRSNREREKISQKVKEIIAEQFGIEPETLTEETILENDLNADSLDAVEMVMNLEDKEKGFGTKIPDEDAEKLTTVGEIIRYIECIEKEKITQKVKEIIAEQLGIEPETLTIEYKVQEKKKAE